MSGGPVVVGGDRAALLRFSLEFLLLHLERDARLGRIGASELDAHRAAVRDVRSLLAEMDAAGVPSSGEVVDGSCSACRGH